MKIRREIKLALTAIIALIILIEGINFLKSSDIFNNNYTYYSVYERVDGLKLANSVVYRGYTVGQVNSIDFIGNNFDKILVKFSVSKDVKFPINSVARIQSADLMGSKVIDIQGGTFEVFASPGDTLLSSVELGLKEQVNEQIKPLKNKAESVMASLDSAIIVLQNILNSNTSDNIENSFKSITRTLSKLEHASGNLDGMISTESDRIGNILYNINVVTTALKNNNKALSNSLKNISSISDTISQAPIGKMLRKADNAITQFDSITTKVNKGEGTLGEIIHKDDLYYNFTSLSNNLDGLITDFQNNPKKYVNLSLMDFGGNGKKENYGVVIYHSETPLSRTNELFLKHPELREWRKSGEFLYLLEITKNLTQAERKVKDVRKIYEGAYIVNLR